MIKQEINAYVNSYQYSGEIVVPSQVLTSTPQNEKFDLTYTPNFQMKLNDAYSYLKVTETVNVKFTYDNVDWNAYADVINRASNGIVTLQYVDGLSYKAIETTATPTINYNSTTYTVTASGDGTVLMYVNGNAVSNPYTFTQGETDVTYTVTATAQESGKQISATATQSITVPAAPVVPSFTGIHCEPSIQNIGLYDHDGEIYHSTLGDNGAFEFPINILDNNNVDIAFDEDEAVRTDVINNITVTTDGLWDDESHSWQPDASSLTFTHTGEWITDPYICFYVEGNGDEIDSANYPSAGGAGTSYMVIHYSYLYNGNNYTADCRINFTITATE